MLPIYHPNSIVNCKFQKIYWQRPYDLHILRISDIYPKVIFNHSFAKFFLRTKCAKLYIQLFEILGKTLDSHLIVKNK
jgi:hypothetical protein